MPSLFIFRHIFASRIYIYTTYRCQDLIYNFLALSIQMDVRNSKLEKQWLGCAIYMKEYTIMMYLSNQIHYTYNNEPFLLVDNIRCEFDEGFL